MSKKRRKLKMRDPQSRAQSMPSLERSGLHAFLFRSATPPETLDEMTMVYQQKIRESALWDEMVKEFGEQGAERILREFRVEIR
jgi:hypothetical protein